MTEILSDSSGNLSIILKRQPNYTLGIFAGIWSITWFVMAIFFTYAMLSSPSKGFAELIIFMCLFSLVAIFTIKSSFWLLRGKERIEIKGNTLIIEKLGTFLTLKSKFEVQSIGYFRKTAKQESPKLFRLYGLTGGMVEFDYYGNTKVFGQTLTDQEAEKVIEVLNKRISTPNNS